MFAVDVRAIYPAIAWVEDALSLLLLAYARLFVFATMEIDES
jgi:hypothetical protein